MTKPYTITAQDFRELIWSRIENLPAETEISFGGGDLMFHTTGYQGDILNIEFNQAYTVTADPDAD